MEDSGKQVFDQAMNNEAFRRMMERIESSNAGQEKYARRQYRMSQVTAFASVVILAVVLYTASVLIPRINVTYQNMELIMEDMKVITSELAQADIDQMITDVDKLAVDSQGSIQEAMAKIDSIDIEGLNKAIRNLSDAVEPFAKFFQRFQ